MRYGVALALALILFGVLATPFSSYADDASSTPPTAENTSTTTDSDPLGDATTTPDVSFDTATDTPSTNFSVTNDTASSTSASTTSLDEPDSPLAPNEEYIELPISYDADSGTYYFSGLMPYCDTTPFPSGASRRTKISWYVGTYPDFTDYPAGGTVFNCATDLSAFGKDYILPILDVSRYSLAHYDGERSILIDNGTTHYILRYSATGGILTTPGSPPIDTNAPFTPVRDPINEHAALPATVTDGVFAVDKSVCDLFLSSVGGMGNPSAVDADRWAGDRTIWMTTIPPQNTGSYGPDKWPSIEQAPFVYQMRTQSDPGTGNTACPGLHYSWTQYPDYIDLDTALFPKHEDGRAYFFFWSSTRFRTRETSPLYSNARPLGYVALDRINGVWSIATSTAATTTCSGNCADSVLFLPGIEGSRLYDGDGTKLWEPVTGLGDFLTGDAHVRKLFLDANGNSVDQGIHTKEGDIIDSAGGDIYGSFEQALDGWKNAGTITDWRAIAYDWRLSLDDLLDKGAETDGNISYLTATDTPYIIQTLHSLAAEAPSGKVTIIAHSNGGLLAKALMLKLGDQASSLVDKIILVAVPQSGAPEAFGGILFGLNQGIYFPNINFPLVDTVTARELAENTPMAYHLLPSQAYFNATQDPAHPVGLFDSSHLYAKEKSAYGNTIDNWPELSDFLLAKEDGRTQSVLTDIIHLLIGNEHLTSYAKSLHDALDFWTPPAGVNVYQIAGWGISDTVAGVRFYDQPYDVFGTGLLGYKPMYQPIFTEDGDGTVPIPSALLMSTSTDNVRRYWFDLNTYNHEHSNEAKISHGNILSTIQIKDLIQNIVGNIDSLPTFMLLQQPSVGSPEKKLIFFLHSPLTLGLYDDNGNHTGLNADGSFDENIPNTSYGEFGEVKYIIAPAGTSYKLVMKGQDSGTFSLDIQEQTGDTVTQTTTISDVPTTKQTTATLTISNGINDASPLTVDENGDGTTDITIVPEEGKTTLYEAPSPSENPVQSASSGGGSKSSSDGTTSTTTSTTTPAYKPHGLVLGAETSVAVPQLAEANIGTKASARSPNSSINQSLQQTVAEYGALSQQSWFHEVIDALYNGGHNLLNGFIAFFNWLLLI